MELYLFNEESEKFIGNWNEKGEGGQSSLLFLGRLFHEIRAQVGRRTWKTRVFSLVYSATHRYPNLRISFGAWPRLCEERLQPRRPRYFKKSKIQIGGYFVAFFTPLLPLPPSYPRSLFARVHPFLLQRTRVYTRMRLPLEMSNTR